MWYPSLSDPVRICTRNFSNVSYKLKISSWYKCKVFQEKFINMHVLILHPLHLNWPTFPKILSKLPINITNSRLLTVQNKNKKQSNIRILDNLPRYIKFLEGCSPHGALSWPSHQLENIYYLHYLSRGFLSKKINVYGRSNLIKFSSKSSISEFIVSAKLPSKIITILLFYAKPKHKKTNSKYKFDKASYYQTILKNWCFSCIAFSTCSRGFFLGFTNPPSIRMNTAYRKTFSFPIFFFFFTFPSFKTYHIIIRIKKVKSILRKN